MYPEQSVVSGRGSQDSVGFAEAAVDIFKPFHKTEHSPGTDGNMAAYADIATAQFARNNVDNFPGIRIFHPEQFLGKQFPEPVVDFLQAGNSGRAVLEASFINPFLNSYMGLGFKLEVTLFDIGAVVVFQRFLDIGQVGVMTLDKVAVVAVHRSYETGERLNYTLRQTATKTRCALRQFNSQVRQFAAVS